MWYVYIYMCRTVITLECMEYYHASPYVVCIYIYVRTVITLECMEYYHASPYVVCIYIYVPYCHNPGVHGVLPRKPVCGIYIYIYICRTVITLECMEYYHASPYVVCIYIYMCRTVITLECMEYYHASLYVVCIYIYVRTVITLECMEYYHASPYVVCIYIYMPYCHNPGVHGVLPRKPVCGMYIYIYAVLS